MNVLYALPETGALPYKTVLALGTFDGVHIGHQALIREAKRLAEREGARVAVCTFDRHPLSVLAPERAPNPLTGREEQLERFEKLGVDTVLYLPFTKELGSTPAEEYLENLVSSMRAVGVVAGENHRFGRGGQGNADMILRKAQELGVFASVLMPILDDGDVVSSTLVRSLLENGENARAARLLAL